MQIYDYVDVHVGVLERMYHKRLKGYAAEGYKIKAQHQKNEEVNVLYTYQDYFHQLINDINASKKSIIISSPIMQKKKVKALEELLQQTFKRGVRVILVTKSIDQYKEINRYWMKECVKKLSDSGLIVIFNNDIHQKFAVLDDEIIWYGSLSLLGYHSEEDTIMRLENSEIANELLGIIETGGKVE